MNMQVLLSDELKEEIKVRYGHRKHEYQVNLAVAIGHKEKCSTAIYLKRTW
jgi:hypothetical protein